MRKNKKFIITTLAVVTAIVGVAVAVGTYLKRKADAIGENLDFDDDIYFEDDEYFDEKDENLDDEEEKILSEIEEEELAELDKLDKE